MDLTYNIKHHFDLKGLKIGDTFLGCCKCWFRYEPHTGTSLKCPKCYKEMKLYTVTESDKDSL